MTVSFNVTIIIIVATETSQISGDNGVSVTPVPIPNTMVKPHSADGTAWETEGRVGRCQVQYGSLAQLVRATGS